MYRDVAQWTGIRRRILRDGVSISQVVRETGISGKTVCKMLKHPLPNDTGQGAGGIQSSGRTPPPYSEYSGRIVLCRLRLGSLSGIFTSASATRKPSAAVTTL